MREHLAIPLGIVSIQAALAATAMFAGLVLALRVLGRGERRVLTGPRRFLRF